MSKLDEAVEKLTPDDLRWLDWVVNTHIAEYMPHADYVCPGYARKERFRELIKALTPLKP